MAEHDVCVCCSQRTVAQVEVSFGFWAGVCAEHLARRVEADARHETLVGV
jgi:hypothetical protein